MTTARNPILSGFYPDPSICRVGEDFYLVNSSCAPSKGCVVKPVGFRFIQGLAHGNDFFFRHFD